MRGLPEFSGMFGRGRPKKAPSRVDELSCTLEEIYRGATKILKITRQVGKCNWSSFVSPGFFPLSFTLRHPEVRVNTGTVMWLSQNRVALGGGGGNFLLVRISAKWNSPYTYSCMVWWRLLCSGIEWGWLYDQCTTKASDSSCTARLERRNRGVLCQRRWPRTQHYSRLALWGNSTVFFTHFLCCICCIHTL